MTAEQDILISEEPQVSIEQDEDVVMKKKIKWLPLEANPDIWNKIIHDNGVDPGWSFTDVYGLDAESLAMIPQPVAAIIFLFPITDAYEEFREKEETHLKVHEQNISPNLIYYKQTISNACGMMALLHSVANNNHLVVGPGVFQTILQATGSMSPEERAEYLENCAELAQIHASSAHEGQTETPDITEQLRLHFICFVEVDDHLYELDGRRSFPINHGKCSNFIESTAKIMTQFVERNPEEKEYSAIAFSQVPVSQL
ncbi:ubiquitin carboxyl-terminal hydrolase isozyme L3 [Mucor ambiguus]|uniref:Ubiquitin carboxyl-terminal hydrolase n=1 Tax=Mucor ambiguus TaxID=91626 RepID=A0A0C9M3Z7_9FUNG|nr:ubiquitin carboxyl-terminal hydrolase isozyme L3 [Mucor ambiguus]